jgi:hypothetical protein
MDIGRRQLQISHVHLGLDNKIPSIYLLMGRISILLNPGIFLLLGKYPSLIVIGQTVRQRLYVSGNTSRPEETVSKCRWSFGEAPESNRTLPI